jgi:hypothetical protein
MEFAGIKGRAWSFLEYSGHRVCKNMAEMELLEFTRNGIFWSIGAWTFLEYGKHGLCKDLGAWSFLEYWRYGVCWNIWA